MSVLNVLTCLFWPHQLSWTRLSTVGVWSVAIGMSGQMTLIGWVEWMNPGHSEKTGVKARPVS